MVIVEGLVASSQITGLGPSGRSSPRERTTFPCSGSLADIFPINVVGLLFSVIVSAADELISVGARLKDSESLGLVLCSNSSKLETPSPSISSS